MHFKAGPYYACIILRNGAYLLAEDQPRHKIIKKLKKTINELEGGANDRTRKSQGQRRLVGND